MPTNFELLYFLFSCSSCDLLPNKKKSQFARKFQQTFNFPIFFSRAHLVILLSNKKNHNSSEKSSKLSTFQFSFLMRIWWSYCPTKKSQFIRKSYLVTRYCYPTSNPYISKIAKWNQNSELTKLFSKKAKWNQNLLLFLDAPVAPGVPSVKKTSNFHVNCYLVCLVCLSGESGPICSG